MLAAACGTDEPATAASTFAETGGPEPGPSLAIVAGNDQTAVVTAQYAPLMVRAVDVVGDPIAGAEITFQAPVAGASALITPSVATTDAGGVAVVVADALTVSGSYIVLASMAGAAPIAFDLRNLPDAAVSVAVVGGNGKSTAVATPFGGSLDVVVSDAYGNPVPGETVTFSAPAAGASAVITGSPATTDLSGVASVAVAANLVAGSYDVVATIGHGESVPLALTNLAGAAASIYVASGDQQQMMVTKDFAEPVVFAVRDLYDNPAAGVTVDLVAPSSGATAATASSLTTDAQGHAAVSVIAGDVAGEYGLTATVGLDPGTVSVTAGHQAGDPPPPPTVGPVTVSARLRNLPDVPATVAVAPSSTPQAAMVQTPFVSPLAVTVADRFGNPTPGTTVEFAMATAGAGPSAILAPSSTVTDEDGRAEVSATAGGVAGAYVVTATVAGVAAPASFALHNLAGAPSTVTATGGVEQSAEVDTDFAAALEVIVLDAGQNPVAGAAVTFTAPADGATAVLAASSVATDGNGVATVALRAGTVSGVYQITATIANGAAPAVFDLRNTAADPASVVASMMSTPQQSPVMNRFSELLLTSVRDRFGNPVPGVTVTFRVPASGASGLPRVETAVTDDDGRTAIAFTAGTIAGSYQVTAGVAGVAAPAVFSLTNRHGAPHHIVTVAGDGQRAVVGTAFGGPLVALVEDAQGNPVPGTTVTFSISADGLAGAVLATTTAITGADGRAATTLTANTVRGAYVVAAAAAEGAEPAGFAVRNEADVPADIATVASATPQSTEIGHGFAERIAVTVFDRFGNRVPGARVTFDGPDVSPRAQLEAAEALSGDDGVAAVRGIADDVAGTYEIVAHVDGVPGGVVFVMTHTAAAPSVIVVVEGAGQRALATTSFGAPLVFRVFDHAGNPVAGAALTITTPGSGATVTMVPGVRMTEADGGVPVAFAAGAVVGDVDVVVSVAGAQVPAIARLSVDAIPTELTASAPAPSAGEPVVVSVDVSSVVGIPAGDVEVLADGVVVGTARLKSGKADVEVSPSRLSGHSVVVRFPAQGAFGASASDAIEVEAIEGDDESSGGCNAADDGAAGGLAVGLALFALFALFPRPRRARARRRNH